MRKLLAFLILLQLSAIAFAQEIVVWGSEVVDISSEYSPLEYSGIQALHKPNVLPGGGDNPNAWRPKSDHKADFIMVSFDKPIRAKQVAIAESENPGAVTKVYAYDGDYNEYTLFELTPRVIPLKSRLLNLFFENTPYDIHAIKVVIDGDAVPGYNAIDAIGISASNLPISVLINLAPGIAQGVAPDKLGPNVNSQYVEHSPVISPDGMRLYFSRRYHPDNVGGIDDVEDIWYSEMNPETGDWLPAKNIGEPLNTKGPNFISSITMIEGEEVLILGNRYGKKGRMYSGVSMSKRNGAVFAKPESIVIENDYNYSPKVDYFLAPDGKAMLVSAERDDSYGGRDLYVTFQNESIWSAPKNLGIGVNTASDDFSPFLGIDGRTLYFSTSGISGYGGADIFVTMRLDSTWENWSDPENLGSSVNSEGDDQYFSIPNSGRNIYFSRGDVDDNTDIFQFKADDIFIDKNSPLMASLGHLTGPDISPVAALTENNDPKAAIDRGFFATISGRVTDESGGAVAGAPVVIERLPDGVDVGETTTDEDGNFELTVRDGARYGIMAKKEGYLSSNQNFDFNDITKNENVTSNLQLSKKQTGVSIVLNNIFFDLENAELKTSSYPELHRILEYLKGGDIEKIEISGHTDTTGSPDYNQNLSERRANAVYAFFITNGIEKEKIRPVGYGETKPLYPNDTRGNREKNRRVEFKILQ